MPPIRNQELRFQRIRPNNLLRSTLSYLIRGIVECEKDKFNFLFLAHKCVAISRMMTSFAGFIKLDEKLLEDIYLYGIGNMNR